MGRKKTLTRADKMVKVEPAKPDKSVEGSFVGATAHRGRDLSGCALVSRFVGEVDEEGAEDANMPEPRVIADVYRMLLRRRDVFRRDVFVVRALDDLFKTTNEGTMGRRQGIELRLGWHTESPSRAKSAARTEYDGVNSNFDLRKSFSSNEVSKRFRLSCHSPRARCSCTRTPSWLH